MDEMLRHRIEIHGVVQGVGFRPGSQKALHLFLDHIRSSASRLSKIRSLAVSSLEPRVGESGFSIRQSRACSDNKAAVTPDLAICQECLHELMDEKSRRYCDPFMTCTQCGPRYTMVSVLP